MILWEIPLDICLIMTSFYCKGIFFYTAEAALEIPYSISTLPSQLLIKFVREFVDFSRGFHRKYLLEFFQENLIEINKSL